MNMWNSIKTLMFPDTSEEGVITQLEKSLVEVKEIREEIKEEIRKLDEIYRMLMEDDWK